MEYISQKVAAYGQFVLVESTFPLATCNGQSNILQVNIPTWLKKTLPFTSPVTERSKIFRKSVQQD